MALELQRIDWGIEEDDKIYSVKYAGVYAGGFLVYWFLESKSVNSVIRQSV
jgi:hypothetical protein